MSRMAQGVRSKRILAELNLKFNKDDNKVSGGPSATRSSMESIVSFETTKQQSTSPCHATAARLNYAEKENAKSDSLTGLNLDVPLPIPNNRRKSTSVPPLVHSDTEIFSSKDSSIIKLETSRNANQVKISKERSLSFSDLTSDVKNNFNSVKRSQSLPLLEEVLLSGNLGYPNSLSILTLYVWAPEEDVRHPPDSEFELESNVVSVPPLVQSDTEIFSLKEASSIKIVTGCNANQLKTGKERSLSLSDLTSDFQNDFNSVKRTQSLPLLEQVLLSGNHSCPNSPSILTQELYHPHDSELELESNVELFTQDLHDPPDSELEPESNVELLTENLPHPPDSELEPESNVELLTQDLQHPPDSESVLESNVELFGDMDENRKRKHVADPSSWKKNKAKKLRMEGKEYLGYKKPKDGKLEHNTPKPARKMGPKCSSKFCLKRKLRGCDQFTEEARKQMHSKFWNTMNWDQRKVYVTGLVRRTLTNRKTKSVGESRREGTLSYFLPLSRINEEKVQVCKDMFLNTLSLGAFTVQSWVKKAEFGMTPHQEVLNTSRKKTPRAGEERKIMTLKNFLRDIPKLPSHYGRKDTTKLFVEPVYHSLKELFDTYKNYCELIEVPPVSRFTFENMFHKMNLSLFTLKKDMCDVCAAHSVGNTDEADYQFHVIRKDRARSEKSQDKEKAKSGEFILLTMDLEAVKVCPYLKASALFFKTKLTCHNFSVYNLVSNHCTCYWFDETSSDLTASTFTSFVIDYLERHCVSQKKPIVIFSDGCTYQNRNAILSNALLNLSKKYGITITQKYLEPGHTQMECDSVHSAVERKLKNREIHLPSNYVAATKEARKNPYEVIQSEYSFFKNYADPDTWVYKSIRPGRRPGEALVVDLRAILYSPNSTIMFKTNFDEEWSDLPQRRTPKEVVYNQLHSNKLPIKTAKFKHLQELKLVLPADCHSFYDNLPHV